jgi:hypothetical protein
MFSKLHSRFGTAGLVVAIVALVAAVAGTALAASGALTSKQKKEVEKIAKKFAGKQGPAGAAGPAGSAGPAGAAGPAGSAGPTGAKGDTGATGAAGKDGTNGTNGKSVTVTSIAPGGAKCEGRAGAEVKQEGAGAGTPVCEGSPWTAGGTLPSGKTETGSWNLAPSAGGGPATSVSFAIPLSAEIEAANVFTVAKGAGATATGDTESGSAVVKNLSTNAFGRGVTIEGSGIPSGTTVSAVLSPTEIELSQSATATATGATLTGVAPSGCENAGHSGTASAANPEAATGNFCIFAAAGETSPTGLRSQKAAAEKFAPGNAGASVSGAILIEVAGATAGQLGYFGGSWAVTAP